MVRLTTVLTLGVLIDDARGMYASDTIYSDLDIATLASIPRTQPHREVDLAVIDADNEGWVIHRLSLSRRLIGNQVMSRRISSFPALYTAGQRVHW